MCTKDLNDPREKDEQESGSEGKRNEDQPNKTECEGTQVNEELVNCVPGAADTKELEGDDTKETETHQEKEIRVEGDKKQPQGEGESNLGGAEGEREKTPIPPPRRKRKKKLKRNPSLENLEVTMTMLIFHDLLVYLCYLDIHTMVTVHGNICQQAGPSHLQTIITSHTNDYMYWCLGQIITSPYLVLSVLLQKATGDVRIQRSMTVGSVDMYRERPSPLSSSPLTSSHPTADACTTSSPINR